MDKGFEQAFLQDVKMTDNNIKRCSIPSVITEMKIKTPYRFTPGKAIIILCEIDNNKC